MARRAGSYVRRKYYGKRGTRKSKASRGGSRIAAPLTTQRDSQVLSSRGRGRGVSAAFRRNLRIALQNDMPARIYQELLKGSDTDTTGIQGYRGVYLLDLNTTDQGHIWNVFKDAYTLASVADAENKAVFLRSACLDLQLRNADSTNDVFITMYTVVARVDNDINQGLSDQYQTFFSDMAAVGSVAPGTAAMSPYDCPGFVRHWKIIRAVRVKIRPLETASFQLRKRLNRKINGRLLQDQDCAVRGLTQGFFFQMRGAPTNSVNPSGLSTYNVTYSAQTTIHYRLALSANTSDTIGQSK